MFILPSAPSDAPADVITFSDSSSSITVQWEMVPCIHRNGDITGYSVQYGVMGSGSTQTMSVSGASVTEATISSLMSSTTYSIQVAAVNNINIGVYSDPTSQLTLGMKLSYNILVRSTLYIGTGPVHECCSTILISL